MSLKFIIASRPYNHQSFGVVTLHKMHEFLLKNGFESEIIFFDGLGKDYKWRFSKNELDYRKSNLINKNRNYKNYLKEVCEKGIIVYPEGIYGNPLSGKNIVRYLLNKERALKPWGMNASKRDFFLVYSKLYRKNFHHELFNPPSIEWLKELKEGTIHLIYLELQKKLIIHTTLQINLWNLLKSKLENVLQNIYGHIIDLSIKTYMGNLIKCIY